MFQIWLNDKRQRRRVQRRSVVPFGSVCPTTFLANTSARHTDLQAASWFQLPLRGRSPVKEGCSSHTVEAGREASNPWTLPPYLDQRGATFPADFSF